MLSNTYCGNYPEYDHSGCPSSVECYHAVIDDREEEHPSEFDLMWDVEEGGGMKTYTEIPGPPLLVCDTCKKIIGDPAVHNTVECHPPKAEE